MKKTNFKRILSFFLAAVMLFGMLPAVFAQDADTKDVDYAITNPYATVDWKNYGQYKASLHNHSIVSDGDNDFRYVIETYYSMGYDILAITDHGTVDRGWTEPNYVPALQLALGFRRENGFEKPTGLTQERYNQITSGSDRGGRGMLRVPYGIENNPTSFNNSHVNSWFVDYGNGVLGGTSDYETPIKNVEALGGLSIINHPGEYTGARNEKDFDKAYNEDYDYDINKFARLLKMYPSCLGIDVNSKGYPAPKGRTLRAQRLCFCKLRRASSLRHGQRLDDNAHALEHGRQPQGMHEAGRVLRGKQIYKEHPRARTVQQGSRL